MAGGHDIFGGVVERLVVGNFLDGVDDAIGQGLLVDGHRHAVLIAVDVDAGADLLALDHPAVDVEAALLHLDAVARHADHALDVVVAGRLVVEHGDVAALRLGELRECGR